MILGLAIGNLVLWDDNFVWESPSSSSNSWELKNVESVFLWVKEDWEQLLGLKRACLLARNPLEAVGVGIGADADDLSLSLNLLLRAHEKREEEDEEKEEIWW